MAGFGCDLYECWGVLEVDGFSMNTPAWILDGYPKIWTELEFRTDEVLLPTAPGRRSYPSRLDQAEIEMTLYLTGSVNSADVPYADPWMGYYTNVQALWSNVFSPVNTGRGTRPAELTLPDGSTVLTADVKFSPLRGIDEVDDPTYATLRTTLTIPAGQFVA